MPLAAKPLTSMENAIFTVSIKSAQLPEFIALATSENLETF